MLNAGPTCGEVDVRRRHEAALRVADCQAEVVGFPATQAGDVTRVVLGDAQSPKIPTVDGCQGEVCHSVRSVPGHNGSTVGVTLDVYLHLSWHTGS